LLLYAYTITAYFSLLDNKSILLTNTHVKLTNITEKKKHIMTRAYTQYKTRVYLSCTTSISK